MVVCQSLSEVREQIDRLDHRIIPLLAERATYVEQAAGFKPNKAAVVDSDRIEQIISKIRHLAIEEEMDPQLAENIYRAMIDAFILHEAKVYIKLHPQD